MDDSSETVIPAGSGGNGKRTCGRDDSGGMAIPGLPAPAPGPRQLGSPWQHGGAPPAALGALRRRRLPCASGPRAHLRPWRHLLCLRPTLRPAHGAAATNASLEDRLAPVSTPLVSGLAVWLDPVLPPASLRAHALVGSTYGRRLPRFPRFLLLSLFCYFVFKACCLLGDFLVSCTAAVNINI